MHIHFQRFSLPVALKHGEYLVDALDDCVSTCPHWSDGFTTLLVYCI